MAISKAQQEAVSRYESKSYDKIVLRIRKDNTDASGLTRETIKKAADAAGMSLNTFILQAVSDKMKK